MANSTSSQDLRLLLPETVWLEPEHFLLANQTSSQQTTNASNSWQVYLNTLALLAFEVWLRDRLPEQVVSVDISAIATAGNLKVGEYKFCAFATENLLDEIVNIPQELIEQPQLAAHFYVLLEVLEEEEEVVIRGFLPYKKLVEMKSNLELPVSDGYYQLPLSFFDIEPNHLLLYHRYVQASEFSVPVADTQVTQVSENLSKSLHLTTIKLSQWLQGVIDEGWQIIDSLSNPELSLAFSTRNIEQGAQRAKIIDFGIDLGSKKVVLLVNISPDISASTQDKISVLAQLYPINGERFLPQNIKLFLLSKAGKNLQEVTARVQDNYIQLKPFKGEYGKRFSIQVSLGDISVKENFEL
ncbi:DUF1822 family protein [Chlorogloeopsis sp. ULAP02]|uniref:DUF1822 family protein n=1 Tax=Chlorogloeopsis sp. ULAP02 TaxID=3107926 RepID=UPI003136CE83